MTSPPTPQTPQLPFASLNDFDARGTTTAPGLGSVPLDDRLWQEPPSPLAASLALYNLLEKIDETGEGVKLSDVHKSWPETGMSTEDLNVVLTRNETSGDFVTIMDVDGPRLRAAGFESRRLDPMNLDEVDALVQAFQQMKACRRRVVRQEARLRREARRPLGH